MPPPRTAASNRLSLSCYLASGEEDRSHVGHWVAGVQPSGPTPGTSPKPCLAGSAG
jgi:hypothetical protein